MPRHRPVNLAPEGHDQIGDPIEALPAPGVELRRLIVARRQGIEILLASGKAQREPFLPLPAESGEPMRRAVIGWKLVNQPVGLTEIVGIGGTGLFP